MAIAAPIRNLSKAAQSLPLGEGEGGQGGPPATDANTQYPNISPPPPPANPPAAPAPPEVLESRTDPGTGMLLGPSTMQPGDVAPTNTYISPADALLNRIGGPRLPDQIAKLQPNAPSQNGQKKESGEIKIPGSTEIKEDAGTPSEEFKIPGSTEIKEPQSTASSTPAQTEQIQIPGSTEIKSEQPQPPPQSQLPSQFQTPPQPLTVPTPTPESAEPDPHELQQTLIAQGLTPGQAQAVAAGQIPKTLAGKTPPPPTPSASDEAIRAQNEQALAHPPPAAKLPTPVDTLKADEKNRVDPVGLYSYLLGKFAHSPLVNYVPPDGERWGIKTGSAAEWAAFGLAVAKQESDLNTRSYNADDPGGSAGLFQFGQGQTQFTSGQDQFNPQASADAFVRVVEHYLANKGSVANMGETFGSIRRPNEAGQYIAGAQKVAAGGSGKDLVSSGGGEKSAKTSRSDRAPVEQPQISLPGGGGSGGQPQSPSGGGYSGSGGGGGGGAQGGGRSEAGNLSFYPGGFGGGGGGGGEEEQAAAPSPSPRYQPQQMQVSAPLPDEGQNPVVTALMNRGFTQQQAQQLAQGMQNIAPGKDIGPLNVKGPPPPAPSATQTKLQFPSAKQLMPGKFPTIVPKKTPPPAAPSQAKGPPQLPAPPAAPAAPTKPPAVTPSQQAPARQPQQAQAPTPPPGPPKDQPQPTAFTGRPAGSTHGDPNPPGADAITKWPRLRQQAEQHASILSPDDPRVKRQADGYIKGEHFVEGDPFHGNLLNGLPYGKQGRQRQLLGQTETAIADKSPMHISYISAPKEAAKFPTRDTRKVQYDEHSPEARLMGTTEGQLVGHSVIPLSVGVKLTTKGSEPHQSYIQGLSTNVLANNFQHTNDKLAAMGRTTPYKELGTKFSNDLEGYFHNLNAGHTATGRGYAIGTADHPNEPDREHVPYKLSRKEADFIGTVINNDAAFATHEDAKKLRELARANGTLITEKGETNRMRHDIEQHEPGWRKRVLEPSIRTFKTGLIHEVHASEEHMPETIRPGKGYQALTKALARTSERGRPDIPIGASLHHTFADNRKINEIERDFSDHKISELEARVRLKELGEDPGDYRFIGGSGGLITPYEDDPEAITPEEHSQMRDNLRKQWVGGKLNVEDYRKKAAEVPLPSKPSQPATPKPVQEQVSPAEPESEPDTLQTPVAAPKPVPKAPKSKPAPKAPPEPAAEPEEAPEETAPAKPQPPAPDEPLPKAPEPAGDVKSAIRMHDTGKIYEGPSHIYAHYAAQKAGEKVRKPQGGTNYDLGYTTRGAEFTKQRPPTSVPKEKASAPGEKITAAAIRTKDGSVHSGQYHGEAYTSAVEAGADPDLEPKGNNMGGEEEGYLTSHGRFLERKEAFPVAHAANQLNESAKRQGGPELTADDIREELPGTQSQTPKPPAPDEPLPAKKPKAVTPAPAPTAALEKPSWKTANEKTRQAYLKQRVAQDLERQYKGPDAHPLEVDRNDDNSIKYDPSGNPIYKKIDYDLANSPLLKKKGLGQIKDADKHEDTLGNLIGPDGKEVIDPETGKPVLKHAHLNQTERRRLSAMHTASAVHTMGNKIVDEFMKIKDIPEIAAGEGWYSRMREKLAAALGEHHELFAQLLGATSAKTPVRNNFIQSLDALEQYKSGKFDNHIKKYLEGYEKMREGKGALVAHMKNLGIPLYDKDGNTVETHEQDAAAMANWIHHHGILPRQQIQPGQEEGSKYNANSIAVLKALAGTWLKEVGAPKTPNFAGNLTGRTLEATIDVWAARFLKRLGYEGHGEGPWRSQGKSEPGVNSLDFAFSQDAMRHAADEISKRTGKKMNPDDLQAIAWFAEKHHWEKQGWTRGAGAEKSSFDDVADLAFPKTGEPMTSADLRKHYAAIQEEAKRVKARVKTAKTYVGHANPKMRAKLEPYMEKHGLIHEQVHGPEVEEEDEDEAA